mmetsp:Transcript_17574/g.39742  ORF Transcript_17574/g.39742 Transcript_17574/m.39742 type:complete len:238 (-) Transcript_17574:5849-6562(-)
MRWSSMGENWKREPEEKTSSTPSRNALSWSFTPTLSQRSTTASIHFLMLTSSASSRMLEPLGQSSTASWVCGCLTKPAGSTNAGHSPSMARRYSSTERAGPAYSGRSSVQGEFTMPAIRSRLSWGDKVLLPMASRRCSSLVMLFTIPPVAEGLGKSLLPSCCPRKAAKKAGARGRGTRNPSRKALAISWPRNFILAQIFGFSGSRGWRGRGKRPSDPTCRYWPPELVTSSTLQTLQI